MRPILALALAAGLLTPTLASAQGAGTLTRTAQGFDWKRGAVHIELRDRKRTWSQADADKIKESLDLLPDVLIDYAVKTRCTTFYRDDVPRGRFGIKRKNAAATTVFEKGYVAYGDSLLQQPAQRVYRTVVHELGHVAQYALENKSRFFARLAVNFTGTSGFTSISWTSAFTDGLKSYNGFVSDYARSGNREDFAESVEFYWINPDELLRVSPAKHRFMRDRVFNQLASPATSRIPAASAINPVVPLIRRLGDQQDDPGSLVRIYGTYFMGPLDGGFNRVTYRGKEAIHLPITRSSIYSWVPSLSVGPAPIKVTTQDGASADQTFAVTKPWWKFW